MIGYVDTSVFVPLLVSEPSSGSCRRFWDDAEAIVSSRLLYVETAAALAQAQRLDRLTDEGLESSLRLLDELWPEVDVVEVDQAVVKRAAVLARHFKLRGYDAVHCASAERINDDDVVAAAGDGKLLEAWANLGLATYDANAEFSDDAEVELSD